MPAAAAEYSQFSDTYKPVPVSFDYEHPAAAYPAASEISVFAAAVPAAAGAVPSTATFPVTAACQFAPSASLPEVPVMGVSVEQVPPADGSPITRTAYCPNALVDMPCQVEGVTWVTEYPAFVSTVVSGAVVSPFCSSTSTDTVADFAFGAGAVTAETAAMPAPAATAAPS